MGNAPVSGVKEEDDTSLRRREISSKSRHGGKRQRRGRTDEESESDSESDNGTSYSSGSGSGSYSSSDVSPSADEESSRRDTFYEPRDDQEREALESARCKGEPLELGKGKAGGNIQAKDKKQQSQGEQEEEEDMVGTVFELVPFYEGGESVTDQMVRTTLACMNPHEVDRRDADGNTLLTLAAQHCCQDLIEMLLSKGAAASAVNSAGLSALHYACYSESHSLGSAKALLNYGASPAQPEFTYGCMPLHYAVSTGDTELCRLLVEFGANPQKEDYYQYSAIDYAIDAQQPEMVAALQEAAGLATGKQGGLWARNMDHGSGLAYYINNVTGESIWESELLADVSKFLQQGGDELRAGVKEWLMQQQIRAQLVCLFCRYDPLRLTEVDYLMESQGDDFEGMFEKLYSEYELSSTTFLEGSFMGEQLFAVMLQDNIDNDDEAAEVLDNEDLDKNILMKGSGGDKPARRDSKGGRISVIGSGGMLRRMDSAVLDQEHEKAVSEARRKHQQDIKAELTQQQDDLKSRDTKIDGLSGQVEKGWKEVTALKEQLAEIQSSQKRITAEINDPSAGKKMKDKQEAIVAGLRGDIAGARAQYSHIVEALESMKGDGQESEEKVAKAEEERLKRLEEMEGAAEKEVHELQAAAKETLDAKENTWAKQKAELEESLNKQIQELKTSLQVTSEETAKELKEVRDEFESLSCNHSETAKKQQETLTWMKEVESDVVAAEKIEKANRALHTSLKREMEKAKQLHNQIEDMKGQTRVYARLRPLSEQEKGASCKEKVVRDGKTTVAVLEGRQAGFEFNLVLQGGDTETGQLEFFRDVSGLGTSLADGYSVCFVAAGGAKAGKSFSLVGDPAEKGNLFCEPPPLAQKEKAKKGKQPDVVPGILGVKGCAGLAPRLVKGACAVCEDRIAQCSYLLRIAVVAVVASGASDQSRTLLPDDDSTDLEEGVWLRSKAAIKNEEVIPLIDAALSCAKPGEHVAIRIRLESTNRSSREVSIADLLLLELIEIEDGEQEWPKRLAHLLRSHAMASSAQQDKVQGDRLLELMQGTIKDTTKVITLLCLSPADMHLAATQRVLDWGNSLRDSGGASLSELKKELARLKKKGGGKSKAPAQLPRPPTSGGVPGRKGKR